MLVLLILTVPLAGFIRKQKVSILDFIIQRKFCKCSFRLHFLGLIDVVASNYFLEQHILFGAEEGIYTLNLNELHEGSMDNVIIDLSTFLGFLAIYSL